MAKTSDEVLGGLLSTSLKLDAETVAGLKETDGSWKDDALDKLLEVDQSKVATLNTAAEQRISAKASTVKRETSEEWEARIRDEFGFKDTNVRGIDLVKHAKAALVSANGNVSEDKVKAHPLFMELEAEKAKYPQTLQAALDKQKAELETGFKREANYGIATKRAQVILDGMKPVLPKNAEVAANQRALVDAYVKAHPLDFVDDGKGGLTIVPMKADGTARLEDSHGNAVSYDQFVQMGAKKFFEFQASDDKSAGTDPNKIGDSGGNDDGGSSYDPKTTSEYVKLWQTIEQMKDPVKRAQEWKLLKAAGVKNGVAQA